MISHSSLLHFTSSLSKSLATPSSAPQVPVCSSPQWLQSSRQLVSESSFKLTPTAHHPSQQASTYRSRRKPNLPRWLCLPHHLSFSSVHHEHYPVSKCSPAQEFPHRSGFSFQLRHSMHRDLRIMPPLSGDTAFALALSLFGILVTIIIGEKAAERKSRLKDER